MSGINPVLANALANPPAAQPGYWGQQMQNMNALQDYNAKQAWGQALQQATDPTTGTVDYGKAQALAAGNPMARAGMAANLANASNIRSQQIDQTSGLYNLVGRMSASLMKDPSDANVAAIRAQAVNAGLPPGALTEIDRIAALPVDQRATEAYNHNVGALDALGRIHQTVGQTTLQNFGGTVQPATTYQPTPGQPGRMATGPGVNLTASPDTTISLPDVVVRATLADKNAGLATDVGQEIRISGAEAKRRQDSGLLPPNAIVRTLPTTGGGGVVDSSGNRVSPTNQPRLNVTSPASTTSQPAAPTAPAPLPIPPIPPQNPPPPIPPPNPPPPAPPVATPPVVSTSPTLRGPGTPVPPAPSPSVNAPRDSMTPGPQSSLQGGVPVASANALTPNLGPPGPPSPLVPGDVNAIMQGINRARATPAPGTQQAVGGSGSFAAGPGYDEQVNATTSQERLAADTKIATNYAANVFPYTQALSTLGRGMTTAPGSDFLNAAKGFAGGMARSMGFGGTFDSTKDYDELHKWLSQIVTNNPVAQGSDARLAATLAGNANTGIHELASADMMKAGTALMRMNATASSEWANNPQVRAQYGYYNDFLRDFNKNVDPRAFAWDMYNPEQKKTLLADIDSHDEAYAQKFLSSRNMAQRNGYLGETRAMP